MQSYSQLIVALGWISFWIYWLLASRDAKRTLESNTRRLRLRVGVVVLALLILRLPILRHTRGSPPEWSQLLGLVIFALGVSLAVWARRYIGRNWGMPMSLKEDPELVRTGPYRAVRHPIYSGLLLALAGSALAVDWKWFVVLVLAGAYFFYSARTEEANLIAAFPSSYEEYRASTKMFIPFIL